MASKKKVSESASAAKYEETVQFVLELMNKRTHKGEIKKQLKKRNGIEFRQAENYIAEARRRLVLELDMALEEHRADSYAFYNSIVTNENLSARDRIRAQECIDKLVGSRAPAKVSLTDTNGNDIEDRSCAIDRIRDLAARVSNRG